MAEPPGPLPRWVAAAVTFLCSGAVLVLEIVGLRLIAPYVGVTVQTSTAVIGFALAAIAIGAWTGGATADRTDPRRLPPPEASRSASCSGGGPRRRPITAPGWSPIPSGPTAG